MGSLPNRVNLAAGTTRDSIIFVDVSSERDSFQLDEACTECRWSGSGKSLILLLVPFLSEIEKTEVGVRGNEILTQISSFWRRLLFGALLFGAVFLEKLGWDGTWMVE